MDDTQQKVYIIWDSTNALKLRQGEAVDSSSGKNDLHRIIPTALGTLPQTPQQSECLGAPFVVPVEQALLNVELRQPSVVFNKSGFQELAAQYPVVMDGGKFGADWTLYTDDPIAVHSHALVHECQIGDYLRPSELVTLNRVATCANKHALLLVNLTMDKQMAPFQLLKVERWEPDL